MAPFVFQWHHLSFLSGWQDSNLRPPHPKCGAIPGYATPRVVYKYNRLKSGWQDSNLRPPHPKCGAIPGYATPRTSVSIFLRTLFLSGRVAVREGFEPSVRLPVRQFSKLFLSASQAPHPPCLKVCKYSNSYISAKIIFAIKCVKS